MTHFLILISKEGKEVSINSKEILSLFPEKTKIREDFKFKNIRIFVSDFLPNYCFSKEGTKCHLATNILKYPILDEGIKPFNEKQVGYSQLISFDSNNNEMEIITDPFGFDFIYIAEDKNSIILSSHLKYIIQYNNKFLEKLNLDSVINYLYSHMILGTKTLFQDISLLPYNRVMKFNYKKSDIKNQLQKNIKEAPYHFTFPNKYDDEKNIQSSIEECSLLLKKLTKTLADSHNEKIGFMLSGGLDSRTLVSTIPNNQRKRCEVFTFDSTKDGPEIQAAKEVLKRIKLKHNTAIISLEKIVKNIYKHMWLSEGVSNHLVSGLITLIDNKPDINMIVDGYLGDTQFGGEFFSSIEEKHKKYSIEEALKLNMKMHNYSFSNLIFKSIVKDDLSYSEIIDENISEHVKFLWNIDSPLMKIETLLAQTRGRCYSVGGPRMMHNFGDIIFPYYNPEIFSCYITVPYQEREKRKFELSVLKTLNEELAYLTTTAKWYKRLKIVQLGVKTVRWFENLLGIRILPRAAYPRPSWFDKTSPYRKFLTEIIDDDNAIIWLILKKENTRKLFYDLFNNKNNLGLLLAHIIDLELTLRIFLSINPPEKITFYSKILDKEIKTKIKLDLSNVSHKIKYKK
ncbi:MAG: asparagine synthase-related protein [Candidatus Thorarchaeota archaeon]